MHRHAALALSLALLIATLASSATPHAAEPPRMIACAGKAARDDEGHVDVGRTLAELKTVGCNAYLYDLPNKSDAWARLPQFADAAKSQGVDVYVYLAPFTLAHKGGGQDGPFGTDYVAWCAGVAKLAAEHPAIAGVVIDDFASNLATPATPGWFTVDSVRRMRAALNVDGRALRLMPVLYFSLPLNQTLTQFGPLFTDGAILSYPRAAREIDVADANLNDAPRGASFGTATPHKTLRPGQGAMARTSLSATEARRAETLTFFVNDQNASHRRGRHRLVVRVDGRVVWEHVVANESYAEDVKVPLQRADGAREVQVGVISDEPSEEAVVHIAFDDVSLREANGERIAKVAWREGLEDGMELGIVPQREKGEPRWRVPMTLLIAGAPFEDEKRYGEPGTPDQIAGRVGTAVDAIHQGKANGVVVWFLPLDGSKRSRPLVDAVAARLQDSAKTPTSRPTHKG